MNNFEKMMEEIRLKEYRENVEYGNWKKNI